MPKTSENLLKINPSHIIFLSVEEVLAMHRVQINRFGGTHGVRDRGLLESAILAPQMTFGGIFLCDTLFKMAATYAHGILNNHAFVDGNKRTGTTATIVFLKANDIHIVFKQDELFNLAISIVVQKLSVEAIANILQEKCLNESF